MESLRETLNHIWPLFGAVRMTGDRRTLDMEDVKKIIIAIIIMTIPAGVVAWRNQSVMEMKMDNFISEMRPKMVDRWTRSDEITWRDHHMRELDFRFNRVAENIEALSKLQKGHIEMSHK